MFDIETIPDVATGRRLYGLADLDDAAVARAMAEMRREQTGSDFLRHPLHRIVAISVVLRRGTEFRVWSLGEPDAGEAELVRRFFDGIDRFGPILVSWNGSGFDLPVLQYRALLHGIPAPRYWETGENDASFRWNNYLSRYHTRHTDLMDVLSGYQARACAPLHEIAVMLGLPGKLDMHGAEVFERYCAGNIADIRNYCETDVVNTYLIYSRWQLLRGGLSLDAWRADQELVRSTLALEAKTQSHWQRFLDAWRLEDRP
ncbi:MAG TPA: 3'-5' exonuclease [Acidiferrobacteraceae bacterium]|nr:3'-5' exonuclease [Acidiferrobacteraceae bacterium]